MENGTPKQRSMKKARSFIADKPRLLIYHPISDSEDINLEPLTLKRIMKQIQVELLKPIDFHTSFGVKYYPVGIHSLDRDLAKLLIRAGSARYILPHKEVLPTKQSNH